MARRTILSDYYDLAIKYKELAEASMEKLDKCKQEMMQMKAEIMNRTQKGQYLWDSNRIIISAPEIIIGNVNMNGELMDSGKVIIKGSNVSVDGVNGKIVMRAPIIQQRAVNPGNDGNREVVGYTSKITSEAREICLSTQDPQHIDGKGGVFLPPKFSEGITLTSDTTISLNGTKEKETKERSIKSNQSRLESEKQTLKDSINTLDTELRNAQNEIENNVDRDKDLTKEKDLEKTNILALDELQTKQEEEVGKFLRNMNTMIDNISSLAETNRQCACLKAELENISLVSDKDFKEKSTETSVNIKSEKISLISADGEGNVRTNQEAQILLRGNKINLESTNTNGILTPKESMGRVSVISRNIELSTSDIQNPNKDLTKFDYPAVGNVTIRSKTVDIESMDYKKEEKQDGDGFEEKELTKGSSINIRSEKVKVKTIDHTGKSVGKFSVNSQKITMKATDIKDYNPQRALDEQGNFKHPDKMESLGVAKDSKMLLLAETMSVGYKDTKDKQLAKKIQVGCEDQLILWGSNTAEVGNGNDWALFRDGVIVCADTQEILTVTGKKTEINGKIALEGEVTAGDVKVQNLEAEKCIKSPNLTDGLGVPLVPKPSTKKERIQLETMENDDEE